MIHLNSNRNRQSAMFNRRPRGYIPAVLIVFLSICFVYVLYLNNSLHVKVKDLDEKAKHHRSQHQSLSSQLQVVYQDRSRLENSLHKEKSDHQNTKDELQLQKETHENIIKEVANHQEKYSVLENKNADLEEKMDRLKQELNDVTEKKKTLAIKKGECDLAVQNYSKTIGHMDVQKKELEDRLKRLKVDCDIAEQQKIHYAQQITNSQDSLNNYKKLTNLLKRAGYGVLRLDHEVFESLTADERQTFFSYFTGSAKTALEIEKVRQHLVSKQTNNQREKENQAENLVQPQNIQNINSKVVAPGQTNDDNDYADTDDDRDNVAVPTKTSSEEDDSVNQNENHQDPNEIQNEFNPKEDNTIKDYSKICVLPLDEGHCDKHIASFYFDSSLSVCRPFFYNGCGGNLNRFQTLQLCEYHCFGFRSNFNHFKTDDVGIDSSQKKIVGKGLDHHDMEPQDMDKEANLLQNGSKPNQIKSQELHFKAEEKLAQQELEKINKNPNILEDGTMNRNEAIITLDKLHNLEKKIVKEKQENMKRLADMQEQKRPLEGHIEDDEGVKSKINSEEEDQIQLLEPPGVRPPEEEKKSVIDLPMVVEGDNHDLEDNENYEEENYDDDNNGEDESEEEFNQPRFKNNINFNGDDENGNPAFRDEQARKDAAEQDEDNY